MAGGITSIVLRGLVGPDINEIQYDKNKEPKKYKIRNLILVVLTLIAGATFQAGVNPPGGVWQDNQTGVNGHVAGSAIFAYRNQAAYNVFLLFNTLAFATSTYFIFALTQGFPFGLEIRLPIFYIVVTYVCAVYAISRPESASLAYVLVAILLPIVVRFLIRLCPSRKERESGHDSSRDTTDDVADDVM